MSHDLVNSHHPTRIPLPLLLSSDNMHDGIPTKYVICSISMINGPIRFIFYSLVVLMSTSKPQNMKLKLPLVFELRDDILENLITRHSTAHETAMNKLFFQNPCLVFNFQRIDLPRELPESLRIFGSRWVYPHR